MVQGVGRGVWGAPTSERRGNNFEACEDCFLEGQDQNPTPETERFKSPANALYVPSVLTLDLRIAVSNRHGLYHKPPGSGACQCRSQTCKRRFDPPLDLSPGTRKFPARLLASLPEMPTHSIAPAVGNTVGT